MRRLLASLMPPLLELAATLDGLTRSRTASNKPTFLRAWIAAIPSDMILSEFTGLDEDVVYQELPGRRYTKNERVNPLEHSLQQNYSWSHQCWTKTLSKEVSSMTVGMCLHMNDSSPKMTHQCIIIRSYLIAMRFFSNYVVLFVPFS